MGVFNLPGGNNIMRKALILAVLYCLVLPYAASADQVGGGDIRFTPKNASVVIFSHEKHVSEKGLKCTGCHYQIFQMAQGSYKMDMSRITKGDFCGKCHNGEKSFDVKDQKNCGKCHH
jgi:c(7)-type cytochrome triheme protein